VSLPRLVYLGTPAMAVPTLQALVAAGYEIPLVVTRVDKRRGRGNDLSPSPVKAAALGLGLAVSHRVDDAAELAAAGAVDLGVVVAFGQIIKPHVLSVLPMVNLHFSELPRWRGAAPVERAILAGDERTAVGVMAVEEGLDTGGLFAQTLVPIEATTTADALRTQLIDVGTSLLLDTLVTRWNGRGIGNPQPQPADGVTYAAKITPDDLRLDWTASADVRHRQVRVGGAWTTLRGKRLKVLAATLVDAAERSDELSAPASAGDVGGLRLEVVQPEGRGPQAWRDFVNGARLQPGDRLGT
jgi:methionyl-tRNA formyltransferase